MNRLLCPRCLTWRMKILSCGWKPRQYSLVSYSLFVWPAIGCLLHKQLNYSSTGTCLSFQADLVSLSDYEKSHPHLASLRRSLGCESDKDVQSEYFWETKFRYLAKDGLTQLRQSTLFLFARFLYRSYFLSDSFLWKLYAWLGYLCLEIFAYSIHFVDFGMILRSRVCWVWF